MASINYFMDELQINDPKISAGLCNKQFATQNSEIQSNRLPHLAIANLFNKWISNFYGLKSIDFINKNVVRKIAEGKMSLNLIQYTFMNMIFQDIAYHFHDNDIDKLNDWQNNLDFGIFKSQVNPSISPDFFSSRLGILTYKYDLAWNARNIIPSYNYPLSSLSSGFSSRDVKIIPEILKKLDIIRDNLPEIISQQEEQEMDYMLSLLYLYTEIDEKGDEIIKAVSNSLSDRHIAFGQRKVRSIGMRSISRIYYTRTDGSVHFFIYDGIHQLMMKDLGKSISVYEVLDSFKSGYISNEKIPISQESFRKCMPLEYILHRNDKYVEVMKTISPIGKMYPLIYRENGKILNQILNDPNTFDKDTPANDYTKREVFEALVPHATEWISDEMLLEAVCDWQYDTLEDYQNDGHPGATEQEFVDKRKTELATLIAHNYGVFENVDHTWSVQAGQIVVDGTTIDVDMRLFWFFFEHANSEIVHDKTVKVSDRLTQYQTEFLKALEDSDLLTDLVLNNVAKKYLEELSTSEYPLQDMFAAKIFQPHMFWYALHCNPVISETDRLQ